MIIIKRVTCFFLFLISIQWTNAQLVIQNVNLIDGTGKELMSGMNVKIEGNKITAISNQDISVGRNETAIDGTDKYLIPGLMDMHIHLTGGRGDDAPNMKKGTQALHGFLYSGITTVYDAGNNPNHILPLRSKERAGEIKSPRIFATGSLVTVSGGHGGGEGAVLVESWPQDKPKIEKHLETKPDMVKFTFDEHGWGTRPLIPLLPIELMRDIAAFYNENGVRTTVHISHEYRAKEAIDAGVNTLAHPIIQGPVSDGFVKLMAVKRVPMVSTLTIGEGYSRLVDHPEFLDAPIYQAVFEPELILKLKGEIRDHYASRSWTTWMKVMTPVAEENLRKIHAAGGVIVLGSDQSNGPASHRELELLVEGGITPLDAITIGTLNGAIFMGKENEFGTIEVGKLADLVMLNTNPLDNISNTQDVYQVIKNGEVIAREKLDLPVNR